MRKSILAAPFVAAAAALTLGLGAAAQASVVGSVSDGNGTAGYYTQSFGQIYTQANATFTLDKPALDQLSVDQNGGIGSQLCNATTGYTAQVGVVPSHSAVGTWDVVVAQGFYVGDPTGTGSPCDGNILFFGVLHHTVIGHVPAGTTVQTQIKEVHHGLVYTVADSQLANFNYYQHSFPGFFNEVGDGVTGDLNILSAPVTNDLVDFSGVTGTTDSGATHGLAYWNAVSVSSGYPGYAPLITPSSISPSGYSCTTVPGHWSKWVHHHRHWIKRKTTCTGGGASSFSIETGSPIGV